MKLSLAIHKSKIEDAFLLFPLVLVFLSEIFHFIAPQLGVGVKFLALLLMLIFSVTKGKFNIISVQLFLIVLPILVIHLFLSFSFRAGLEELIRYLFPVVIIFYSFTLRHKFKLIFKFFIAFLLINIVAQVFHYILWQKGVVLWFFDIHDNGYYTAPTVNGFLRATGIMGFFSLFGFLCLLMFFLVETFYKGKFKVLLMLLAVVGLFASISYKGIITFFILIFILSKKKLQIVSAFLLMTVIFIVSFPEKAYEFIEGAKLRTELYISEGTSARSESYRVMLEHTGLLLGEGLGSFGGPASVTHKSPFYGEVNFNWYGLELATTDTYFPHLFVEIGLLGALAYLLFLLSPLFRKKITIPALRILCIIYFALFFDAAFSYSLNNTGYLVVALIWVFPVIYYTQKHENV
ncbi:hypothetical protein GGR32_000691 [Mesonia hippocampi]|uniref:O-antigen ligase-like membrane protein n=1 Tax=Mesonia hippocampi TaxID=1628250 RepID=A0A840EU47_9FLAO|nr:hypothetical protein [Mesonia hippocampi]MBB4118417.1 hypothetical protein [Mesonia hippocampi]